MQIAPLWPQQELTTLLGGLTSAEGGTGHELGSSSWETITNTLLACTGRLLHQSNNLVLSAYQSLEQAMDGAAYGKFESAVCSSTFNQRCKCCDAKQPVNQWHLKDHQAFCKNCLTPGTCPQDVLQVGGN